MTYRIGGQVVNQGSGVADQPVFVVDTGDADPSNWTVEAATTTNADGSWSVAVGSGDPERYHAVTQFEDGSTLKNAESKPFVTGQPVVRPVEIPIQFEIPSPAISAGSVIPDSVTSRDSDDKTSSFTRSSGLAFSVNESYNAIGARISTNTSGVSRARLFDFSQSQYIASIDISAKSAGDAIAFNNISINSSAEYAIELDDNGNSYTVGYYAAGSGYYPITGSDIDIIARSDDGVQDNTPSDGGGDPAAINDIGNPDNVLG